MHISSYPSIYALGHRAIEGMLEDEVIIEEKVDGSQFSFCKISGQVYCRSKGVDIIVDAPDKMFFKAVETAKELDLKDGWIYRGEYLKTPAHNTLKYSRTPNKNIILFDVMTAPETYLNPKEKMLEAERIGLESVPLFYQGKLENFDMLKALLQNDSILGGCKVEGVVVKNYNRFTVDKKVMIAKFVREDFKEKNQANWKAMNPSKSDFIEMLIVEYKTEARWNKAIQHLRDEGKLEGSPKDIGILMKEVALDIRKDSEVELKERLFSHFWPSLHRGIVGGLPEFYKKKLAESAFKPEPENSNG